MLKLLVNVINATLVHLDLSNNNLSLSLCVKFGEMIENNHSLYGLHMHGNDCYMDGFGFIKVGRFSRHFEYSKNTIISPTTFTGYSQAVNFSMKNPFQFMPITK